MGNSPERVQRLPDRPRRSDLVLQLLLGLNYLKLCADHDNPIGSGVPVDIVAMPDFVVDVDGYAVVEFNKLQDASGLAPAEVGSRAGRVLSILAHLRDLDDESFGLHYVAKTGAVGREVLEQRLGADLRARHLQPLQFPFILPVRETRFAVLGRENSQDRPKRQVAENYHPLTRDDLHNHFYAPREEIAQAAGVYFGTDSVAQFCELFEQVVLGTPSGGSFPTRYVVVDLSTIHDQSNQPVVGVDPRIKAPYLDCVGKLHELRSHANGADAKADQRGPQLVVLVRVPEHLPQGLDAHVRRLWQELGLQGGDALLAYDDTAMHLVEEGNIRHHTPVAYDQRPCGRDAFVAGFLLHRALAAAWTRIPPLERLRFFPLDQVQVSPEAEAEIASEKAAWQGDWCAGLFPNPYTQAAPSPWPVLDAMEVGAALAELWSGQTGEVPDRREWLWVNLGDAMQQAWHPNSTADEPCVCDALAMIETTRGSAVPPRNPLDFFCALMLLAHSWIRGWLPEPLPEQVRKVLLDLAVTRDLVLPPPALWKHAGNRRTRALRLPSADTACVQFALDALRRMSMEERWTHVAPPCDSPDPTAPHKHSERACLFDLDGTLVLSSGLRSMCLKRAFLEMLRVDDVFDSPEQADGFPALPRDLARRLVEDTKEWQVPDVPTLLDHCVELFHLAVYNRSDDWMELLEDYAYSAHAHDVVDFRQVWNHPLSYAVFAQVLEVCLTMLGRNEMLFQHRTPANVLIRASCGECFTDLKLMLGDPKKEPKGLATQMLMGGRAKRAFHREVATWEAQCRKAFQAAGTTYWKVVYEAIPHTKQFLRTLRDVLGVRLYIATEGHHDTQLAKLRTVGLDELIPEACTLSTGAAATPTDHERLIAEAISERDDKIQEYDNLRNRLDRIVTRIDSMANLPMGAGPLPKCPRMPDGDCAARKIAAEDRNELETLRANLDHVRVEKRHLEFYTELWTEYEGKQERAIFSLILSCIMADPEKPGTCLTHFEILDLALDHRRRQARALSFAMVGDREKKDIRPILECWDPEGRVPEDPGCDPVTTVRLLTKDHQQESCPWPMPSPTDRKGSSSDKPPAPADSKACEKPLTGYLAWNPIHALLLLAGDGAWPRARSYDELPPIMNIRLLQSGSIECSDWSSMAWGETWDEKPQQETCWLMNRIIARCSIQGPPDTAFRFATALATTLQQSSPAATSREETEAAMSTPAAKAERNACYHLAWTTAERLLGIMASLGTPQDRLGTVAGILSEAVCAELQRGMVQQHEDHDLMVRVMDRCAIQCPADHAETLAQSVAAALRQSRSEAARYLRTWELAFSLASALAKRMDRACAAGQAICEAVCSEIMRGNVEKNSSHEKVAVSLLRVLAGSSGKALCPRPRTLTWTGVSTHLSHDANSELGGAFYEDWR